ncbi:kinesin motor domain-containing protein [Besnoitia besnoiti]|uniref:Kinesin motor domain-containing protein n=1 Tax=Besnoitia besnoiti TaxID=94643 RepID=A0A2A9ML89_BESBE|nr:kinesin motor domain-containing protein [Besnoitia besnoiti]PFH36220.1 kinesin motor domain-containing protein [Besnoitia besnoiti]
MAENVKVAVRIRPPHTYASLSGLFYAERQEGGSSRLSLPGPVTVEEANDGSAAVVRVQNKLGNQSKFVFDLLFESSQNGRRSPATEPPSGDVCRFSGLEYNTQAAVFERTAKPLCDSLLEGFNASILAYGQTGSGKTYTIVGPQDGASEKSEERGVLPRALQYLFSKLPPHKHGHHVSASSKTAPAAPSSSIVSWSMEVQFVEIYQEQIYDLLSLSPASAFQMPVSPSAKDAASDACPMPSPGGRGPADNAPAADLYAGGGSGALRVRYDPSRQAAYVAGARRIAVGDEEKAMQVFSQGVKNRRTAETKLNLSSSRSHAVFSIFLHLEKKEEPSPAAAGAAAAAQDGRRKAMRRKVSAQLHIVDLAGSERQKDTQASGDRLREAGKINYSLSVLSHVIRELVEHGSEEPPTPNGARSRPGASHIPYRDSKLTFLLMDALGGSSKAALIATLSPSLAHLGETVSTLHFAAMSKRIKNKATAHEVKIWDKASIEEMLRERKRQAEEVQRLRALLLDAKGVSRPPSQALDALSPSAFLALLEKDGGELEETGAGRGFEAREEKENAPQPTELEQRVAVLEAALVQASELHRRDQVDAQKHVDSLQKRVEYYDDFVRSLQRQRSRDVLSQVSLSVSCPDSEEGSQLFSVGFEEVERLRVELRQRELEAERLRACVLDLQEKERPLVALLILLQKHLKYREGLDRLALLPEEEDELLNGRSGDEDAFYCRQQLLVELLESTVNARSAGRGLRYSPPGSPKGGAGVQASGVLPARWQTDSEEPTTAATCAALEAGSERGERPRPEQAKDAKQEKSGDEAQRETEKGAEDSPESTSVTSEAPPAACPPTRARDAADEASWEATVTHFARAANDLIQHVQTKRKAASATSHAEVFASLAAHQDAGSGDTWPVRAGTSLQERIGRIAEMTAQLRALASVFDLLLDDHGSHGEAPAPLSRPVDAVHSSSLSVHGEEASAGSFSSVPSPADFALEPEASLSSPEPDKGAVGLESQQLRELYEDEKRASEALRQQVRWLQRTCRGLDTSSEKEQVFSSRREGEASDSPTPEESLAGVLQEYKDRVTELEAQVTLLSQKLGEKRVADKAGRLTQSPDQTHARLKPRHSTPDGGDSRVDPLASPSRPSLDLSLPLSSPLPSPSFPFVLPLSAVFDGCVTARGRFAMVVSLVARASEAKSGASASTAVLSLLQEVAGEPVSRGEGAGAALGGEADPGSCMRLSSEDACAVIHELPLAQVKKVSRVLEYGKKKNGYEDAERVGRREAEEKTRGGEQELSVSSYVYRIYFKHPISVWEHAERQGAKTKWVTVAVNEQALQRHGVTSPEACDRLLLSVLKGSTAAPQKGSAPPA